MIKGEKWGHKRYLNPLKNRYTENIRKKEKCSTFDVTKPREIETSRSMTRKGKQPKRLEVVPSLGRRSQKERCDERKISENNINT